MKRILIIAVLLTATLSAWVGLKLYENHREILAIQNERTIEVISINHQTNQYVFLTHSLNGPARVTAYCDVACPTTVGTWVSADAFHFTIEKEEELQNGGSQQ
jgi:hypothetical protein